jgi:hypothetical protein
VVCVVCSECVCMVGTVPTKGDEEGGEGGVGGRCIARQQLAAMGLPQSLTQGVDGPPMAH